MSVPQFQPGQGKVTRPRKLSIELPTEIRQQVKDLSDHYKVSQKAVALQMIQFALKHTNWSEIRAEGSEG